MTLCAVGVVIVVVVWAMDPRLLLSNTTTAGGDTGAHVALAQYLKTSLVPHLQVTGWDPGAYDGFPLNTFYFPLPDTLAALGGYLIPFAIAFKLVTILGSVTLPVAAWAFGRLAGLERPRPAVLALATLPFLFDQSFTIYGGNLYSSLAGEYAYSLGLSLALVFLGVVIRGMRTGRWRLPAALLLAACVLCHVVTAGFALVGALVVLVLVGPTRRRLWWLVSSVGTGLLLVAWWAVPFAAEQAYSTNMGWLNVNTFASLLAPGGNLWVLAFAAAGLVFALWRRDRAALLLCTLGVLSAIAVVVDPQGKLYNTRFLPLWWLCAYLVAGSAVAEAGVLVARYWRAQRTQFSQGARLAALAPALLGVSAMTLSGYGEGASSRSRRRRGRFVPWAPGALSVPLLSIVVSLAVVVPDLVIAPSSSLSIGPLNIRHSNVTDWASWNYSGYQDKPGWAELQGGIVATLDRLGRRYGCGRAMWEYNSDLNRFGTPEALMDLPMWTGGCIDSMEGLLFESSTTTPYHFLDQAELSASPSEAMVGLPYGPVDVSLGVEHLQLLGVKYFLASSPSVEAQADADPALSLVATSGPWRTPNSGQTVVTTWKFYVVHDSAMVSPLSYQPQVLVGTAPGQGSWLPVAERWYADPAVWSTELVAGGPASWSSTRGVPDGTDPGRRLPAVAVSKVRASDDAISFHVDRTGVPVLVRISYFPAWHAAGADGPWRAEPNLMVVVPTAHYVTLRYGSTGAGRLGDVLFVVGLVAVVLLWRRRRGWVVDPR
ncbi:MAG TPA: hypothetical protein VMR97_09060 [Acidimicrobiales bacterium]|nr:hypothetical protein [Acidimicrobiales bacterium]